MLGAVKYVLGVIVYFAQSSGQAHLAPPTEATMLLDILQSENELTVFFFPSFDTMIEALSYLSAPDQNQNLGVPDQYSVGLNAGLAPVSLWPQYAAS